MTESEASDVFEAPGNPVEEMIAAEWSRQTGVEPVSRHDRFSELGGTSFGIEAVLANLRRGFGRDLGAEMFADDPTVAELAAAIAELDDREFRGHVPTTTHLTPERPDSDRPRLYCFAGAGASAVSFLPLAARLGRDADIWAFHAHGFLSRGLADRTLAAKARRHVPEIVERQTGSEAPFALLGHSFGGHVALAAARQLAARGLPPQRVILLDTLLPGTDGGSVGDRATDPAGPPPLRRRLLTHWRVQTAGLSALDARTRQAVFWEQEIRLQNRIRPTDLQDLPAGCTVFVTDESETQEAGWRGLATPPEVVRVPGDHLGILSDPAIARTVNTLLHTPVTG